MNSFDFDGVISVGIFPGPDDIIVTGRSYEEKEETEAWLAARHIGNTVYYNSLRFDEKTRESSGEHKAKTFIRLKTEGKPVTIHFEDDDIQAAVIERNCPWIHVVRVTHDLTEKENVRYDKDCNPV